MTIEEQEASINGELIRLTRESRGWVLGDLATRACMSVRQIRQLEEGGTSSFYSLGVKVTAAKRVASLLGLAPEQVFVKSDVLSESEVPLVLASPSVMVSQAESDALSDVSSHPDDTQPIPTDEPAESVAQASLLTDSAEPPEMVSVSMVEDEPEHATQAHQEPTTNTKPKLSLWAILGLFAAALGVAAVMRPDAEPVALEAAPPVQALSDEPSQPAPALVAASAAFTEVASAPVAVASSKAALVNTSLPAPSAASASAPRASASNAAAVTVPAASAPRNALPASAAALSSSAPLKTP